MPHRTSLYIKSELLEKIKNESQKKKINKEELIINLLHSYALKVKGNMIFNRCIQYQEKGKNWKRINLSLEINEYEFFLDIRKFLKLSLSNILFLAIQQLLINSEEKKPFKNQCKIGIYGVLLDNNSSGHLTWKIIWAMENNQNGFP